MNGPEDFNTPMTGEDSSGFEQELARTLKHVDAPEGFAARLMDRAAKGDVAAAIDVPARGSSSPRVIPLARTPGPTPSREGKGKLLAFPRVQAWMGGAIAAMLVAGVFLGQHAWEHHQKQVEAQHQFETAEQITNATLERARQQLREKGISLNP